MVYFIIDNFFIPNNSFYSDNHIIPINANVNFKSLEYYRNSRHIFRDVNCKKDYNNLLNNISIPKPISNKKYNIGHYYIPSEPKGPVIKYEYKPYYTDIFNKIEKKYCIKHIDIYSAELLPVNIIYTVTVDSNIFELEFLLFEFCSLENKTVHKYIPKKTIVFDISEYYTIKMENSNSYTNFCIVCEFVND
tara:strand:- start:558 stop:1130 length:573 start_codon:yes stop_codon:yes gene_type:complete